MIRIYPPNEPSPLRLRHSQLQPGPQPLQEDTAAPRTVLSVVAVTTLGDAMYAFSNTGNCWRITVNPFEIYQLYTAG